MRALLDTHVFLWWILDDPRLSPAARDAIGDPANTIFFSAVSAWELAIKVGLGRLTLVDDLAVFVRDQLRQNRFTVLPLTLDHALRVQDLPDVHHDPFDRALVAQAQVDQLTLITRDANIRRYPVRVLW
ncbi:MAG: type II toxin-antitoxin system VapC family toxin [Actinomycetia bacterium]|nr:type II toxin-antitoxin system VapC family toxin [Actinomycetes bacterium]